MIRQTQSTRTIKGNEMTHHWHLIDLKDQVLGRKVQEIAKLLQGKHKVKYVPHLDSGDHVVVINVKQVVVTGKKEMNKVYTYYSGYPSGSKKITFAEMMQKNPTEIIRHAVTGMLPKNKLRDRRLARLHIYVDEKHPYVNKLKVKS